MSICNFPTQRLRVMYFGCEFHLAISGTKNITASQVWVELHHSRPDSPQNTKVYLQQLIGMWWLRKFLTCTLFRICKISSDSGKTSKILINVMSMQDPGRYQIPAFHHPCYCCMKSSLDDTLQEYSITHPKQRVSKAKKFLCSVSHSLDNATSYKGGIWKSTEMFYFLVFSCY